MEEEQKTQEQHEQTAEVPMSEEPKAFDAPFTPHGEEGVKTTDTYDDSGWSWGGCMLNWTFVLAIKKYKLLFLMLLLFVPVVNAFVGIGVPIFLGLKGREYARESGMFANKDQYLGFMKAVDHAGKILFYVVLAIFVGGLLLMLTVFSSFSGMQSESMNTSVQFEM